MKLSKGTQRRTVVYFSIITLMMVFTGIFMTVELKTELACQLSDRFMESRQA